MKFKMRNDFTPNETDSLEQRTYYSCLGMVRKKKNVQRTARSNQTKTIYIAAVWFFICLGSLSAQQQNLALDFTGQGNNGFQANLSLGWSFQVTQPVKIEALGFFDHFESDEDGLNFDHLIRLWTDEVEPEIIVSSIITNTSTPIPSAAANGRWLFNEIAPVVLLPGSYVIGADDPPCSGDCDRYRLAANQNTIPEIVFGEARSASPPGAPQSSQTQLNGGYFGPSMIAIPILLGDVNEDGVVNLLDVAPFVDTVSNGVYIVEADVNFDGSVDLLDVAAFVEILTN